MRGGGGAGSTRRGGASEGFERWEFWWEHNKDPFLDLKARLAKGAVRSGTGGFLIGRSAPGEAVSANRPSPSDIKNLLLPAFIEGLGESHPDIADSSALAIGRTLSAQDAATALEALKKALGHSEKSAREAATLAMGVLGSVDGVEVLRGILNDTQDGRRLTNHPQGVEDLVRSFAAASLGLIGDPKAIDDLKKVVNDANLSAKLGVKAMSILALGMMRENHEDIVKFLLGLMDDRSLNNIVKAQAPIALGRLNRMEGGSPAARQVLSPKILPLFQDDKTDNDLRRSLAICIGMLATVENAEAIEALMNAVAKSSDEQTRHFAIMALSEIGARDGDPSKHAEVHATLKEFFLRELIQPKRITHQPYGALGLAVYARNEKLGAEVKTEAATKLLDQFNSVSNPSYQGAMAVGLGLLESKIASEDLWKKFEDSNDQPLKGYIAIALGLMRENARAEALRAKITQKGLDQKFRLQLARSLGLMSDTQAVPTLIEYLQSAETLAESSSAAQALGLIGDKSAVQPLLEIMRNKSKQPLQRGFAAVALGIIAEKTALPWNAVFSVDSNYRAKVDALSEILDIL
jgi:HEAT repeat protein